MQYFIFGLDHAGMQLQNDIRGFIQRTGQPNRPEVLDSIYEESIRQIVREYHPDYPSFIFNLTGIPDFVTLNFTEQVITRHNETIYSEAVRMFGIHLWYKMNQHLKDLPVETVLFESCDLISVIICVHYAGERP